jgi:hypothetical protein
MVVNPGYGVLVRGVHDYARDCNCWACAPVTRRALAKEQLAKALAQESAEAEATLGFAARLAQCYAHRLSA